MAELSSGMQAALSAGHVHMFGAVQIDLPAATLRLLDGAGEVMIGGHKFSGRDAVFGVLDSIKGMADMVDEKAPTITLGLIPAGDTALATLIDPAVQGSAVTIMIGVLDSTTGLVVPDPYVMFVGEIDVPTVTWGDNDRRIEYRVVSIAERLFQVEEGRRLSDGFHQRVWPGETGLGMVTGVEQPIAWGQKLATHIETRTNLPSMGGITFERT